MLGAPDKGVVHATVGAIFRLWVQWPATEAGFHEREFGENACNGSIRGENVVNQLEVRQATGHRPTCPMCVALWDEALAQQLTRVADAPGFGRQPFWVPVPGRVYRNIRTGNLYAVTQITRCSETLELRVSYRPVEVEGWSGVPWSRPLHLFMRKFYELEAP